MLCSQKDSRTPLGDLGPGSVVAIERQAELLPELRPIRLDARPQSIENLNGQAGGIGRAFDHHGRNRANQHGFGNSAGAVPADVAGHFAAPGGMPDVNSALQIELLNNRGQIVCVGVEIITLPRLARATMSAAVGGNTAVAAGCEEKHLVFKGIGAQRPTVTEDDGRPASPVLIVNLCSIACDDCAHGVRSVIEMIS